MRRLKFILPFAAAALALAVVTAASARPERTASSATTSRITCSAPFKIGFPTPLTGGAAFLGNHPLSCAKYALKTPAPRMGLKASIVTGDTPVEAGPAPAQAAAQKFIADPKVIAV